MTRSLFAGALLLSTLSWSSPAVAQLPSLGCTFESEIGLVTFLAGPEITLVRDGDALSLNGEGCEGATVTNTDLIQLFAQGPSSEASITIDLAGGPFGPGATDEGDGSSEIEIELYGARTFTLLGTDQADHMVFGRANHVCEEVPFTFPAINVNATEGSPDADIFDCNTLFAITGSSSLVGRGGNDMLSVGGEGLSDLTLNGLYMSASAGSGNDMIRPGTGGDALLRGGGGTDVLDASQIPPLGGPPVMLFTIGEGSINPANHIHGSGVGADVVGFERYIGTAFRDIFWGSLRSESFSGGGGDDEIRGRGGDDELRGQGGEDGILGGEGNDIVGGGPGDDGVAGNAGSDVVLGWAGADQLLGGWGDDVLRGGLGTDSCTGGAGTDLFGGCETKDTSNPG